MLGTIIAWIIIGGIAGWLASVLVRGGGMGIGRDIIVGIVGGFIGGFILGILGVGGGFNGFNFTSLLTAFVGAVILLLLVRLFGGGTRTRA
ncbi:MAG: GlsB/YeaQ/YmgE family stress response membrane protein [Ktedonobacterales bacterium]